MGKAETAFLVICWIFCVCCTTYNIAYSQGYMHGANQVIEYKEDTANG